MPSILELHTSEEHIHKWISYSTLDAEATFFLREVLVREMKRYPIQFEGMKNIFELYCKYWLPFGEVLTDLEREGIMVDLNHLKRAEEKAKQDLIYLEQSFIEWVRKVQPEAYEFNPSSSQQLQQLLFAPFKRNLSKQKSKPSNLDKRDSGRLSNSSDSAGKSQHQREQEHKQAMLDLGVEDSTANSSKDFQQGSQDKSLATKSGETGKRMNKNGIEHKMRNIDTMDEFPIEREFRVQNNRVR